MTAGYLRLYTSILRYGSYFAAAWGALFIRRWIKRHRESVARSWPIAEGVILSGSVSRIRRTSHFHATLDYTYFVQEYRTGKYVQEFSVEANADEFVRLMKDKRVRIRYKQSNPDKSLLEQSVVEHILLLAPRIG
jgi:nitric oxide reductase large subunit